MFIFKVPEEDWAATIEQVEEHIKEHEAWSARMAALEAALEDENVSYSDEEQISGSISEDQGPEEVIASEEDAPEKRIIVASHTSNSDKDTQNRVTPTDFDIWFEQSILYQKLKGLCDIDVCK